MNLKTIAQCIALVMALEVIALVAPITPSAVAQCVSNGRKIGGMPVLNCVRGGRTRCRDTGRRKTVKGRTYKILDCSRR